MSLGGLFIAFREGEMELMSHESGSSSAACHVETRKCFGRITEVLLPKRAILITYLTNN